MCRNIKTLFNFHPPVTDEEARAAALQFVRKITGFNKPSKANEALFLSAVDDIAGVSIRLLRSLETNAPKEPRRRGGQGKGTVARALWYLGKPGGVQMEPYLLIDRWSQSNCRAYLSAAYPPAA